MKSCLLISLWNQWFLIFSSLALFQMYSTTVKARIKTICYGLIYNYIDEKKIFITFLQPKTIPARKLTSREHREVVIVGM